jgi:hypothetical protein
MAKSYKGIATYGNHSKAATWLGANNMVIYDSWVIGEFEHTSSAFKGNPTACNT